MLFIQGTLFQGSNLCSLSWIEFEVNEYKYFKVLQIKIGILISCWSQILFLSIFSSLNNLLKQPRTISRLNFQFVKIKFIYLKDFKHWMIRDLPFLSQLKDFEIWYSDYGIVRIKYVIKWKLIKSLTGQNIID